VTDDQKTYRDLLHELGNARQEKVALQYLLLIAAEQIEELAKHASDKDAREKALKAAERFKRSAEL
jgi:predicted  nucleic acid-binding Zn-ribbon protein